MSVTLAREAARAILLAARDRAPNEACGLLLGSGMNVVSVQATANVAADPLDHFEIDPVALIAAHKAARLGGPAVIGYFHSHPNGLARPSATDAENAARDGRVWIIVANNTITCWCDGVNGFEPLSYLITEG